MIFYGPLHYPRAKKSANTIVVVTDPIRKLGQSTGDQIEPFHSGKTGAN